MTLRPNRIVRDEDGIPYDMDEDGQTAARAVRPGCALCGGTGTDPAFGSPCHVCAREASPLVRWLREQTTPAAARLAAQVDASLRLTPALADRIEQLRARADAETPGSGDLDLVGALANVGQRLPNRPLTEGVWRIGDEAYRVIRSSTGRCHAARLDPRTGAFSFRPELPGHLELSGQPMTLAQAEAFARRSGRCCVCGDAGGLHPRCAARWAASNPRTRQRCTVEVPKSEARVAEPVEAAPSTVAQRSALNAQRPQPRRRWLRRTRE